MTGAVAPWGRSALLARAGERAARYRRDGLWRDDAFDLLAEGARRHKSATAVVTDDSCLSFAELNGRVGAGAANLADLGIGPDDAVLVVVRNDLVSLVAVHAVLRAGAVAMLALPTAGAAHVPEVVTQGKPSLVLVPDEGAHEVNVPAGVAWRRMADLQPAAGPEPAWEARPRDPDRPALVIFTSGSTARPKGVVHSLNTISASARNFAQAMALGPSSGLFVVSPVATVTGLLHAVIVPPLVGARAVLVDGWEPRRALQLLLESGATFFGGPDVLLDRILEEATRRGVDRVPLRGVCVGGSMADRRILARAESRFGVTVMPSYGSSEAPVTCAAGRDEPAVIRLLDEGPPLRGVELRIGSANDPAECCIRGPHVFLGYVDRDLDRAAFDDGWYCTGDLADLSGGRLRVWGRIHDIVIRNGLKVPIAEVEAAVSRLPGVAQAAGYPQSDHETGERLAMAVRPAAGAQIGFATFVDGLLASGLAKWKLPEEIVVWAEPFPETASGKVHRQSVAARSAGLPRLLAPRLRAPS